MPEATMNQMELALRRQHRALLELIDIALQAIHESNDASVTTLHMQRRLAELAESLAPGATKAVPTTSVGADQRSTH